MSPVAPFTAATSAVLSGFAAGIMVSTVVGVVPFMVAQPYGGYVRTVRFLWPRFDPLMPILHSCSLILAVFSAVVTAYLPARLMLGLTGALLASVIGISITKNVPVNRFVSSLDPEQQPADWSDVDPRRAWQHWNRVRTLLAALAFAGAVAAVGLVK
jgi:hypothetical protein